MDLTVHIVHLPQHGINDRLLKRVLGLLLPDHVGERDGGGALDDGGFDVRLKVGAAGWEICLRCVFAALFSRCAPEVILVTSYHSAVGGTLSRGGGG